MYALWRSTKDTIEREFNDLTFEGHFILVTRTYLLRRKNQIPKLVRFILNCNLYGQFLLHMPPNKMKIFPPMPLPNVVLSLKWCANNLFPNIHVELQNIVTNMKQYLSNPSTIYHTQNSEQIHISTSLCATLPQVMQESQHMFFQISDVSCVIANNNATIYPLHDNVQSLYQQALVTFNMEAKKNILHQVDVLDAQINQLKDAVQVTKWALHDPHPKALNHFMTFRTLSTVSYQEIQELVE